MHYVLEEKPCDSYDLTCTFIDDDYDKFIEHKQDLSLCDWYQRKAKVVHDIVTSLCRSSTVWVTVTDSLFPRVEFKIDVTKHRASFDDCGTDDWCEIKEKFMLEYLNYDSALETMLDMVAQ